MKFLDLFFDRRCKLCGAEISALAVCDDCNRELKSLVSVRRRTFSVDGRLIEGRYIFDYDNQTVKKLLFSLKRYADRDLFSYASELYRLAFPADFSGGITFCPRTGQGRRSYGYDQVAEVCKLISNGDKERYVFLKILKRRGFSKQQKNLSLEGRRRNVKGKFRVAKKDIPKNILMVDDVVTTGSTVVSCASEILRAFPETDLRLVFLASRNGFSGE